MVGHVVAFGGASPWMSMVLADSAARGWVTCLVVTDNGKRETGRHFEAKAGYGTWSAPLHVAPALRAAEILAQRRGDRLGGAGLTPPDQYR